MTDSIHDDADDLLHWLNAHSVSISDGIPFSLMQHKWTISQRPQTQLLASLEWLFAQGYLTLTPGLQQPHVRLTSKGFGQLLSAMDGARGVAAPPPAPAAAFNPQPLPPQPAAASVAAMTPLPPLPAAPVGGNTAFIDPTKQPTEIGLRNQVLMVFRDLKLVAGQQLIAMTLGRYWQEMGQRGEHLRAAVDLMLRDGYLAPAVKRYENYLVLTELGHAFLAAPISHPTLLALAQPLRQIGSSYPDDDLRREGLKLFRQSDSLSFTVLESNWKHSRDALIHTLDLLMKDGELGLSPDEPLQFNRSARGASRRR